MFNLLTPCHNSKPYFNPEAKGFTCFTAFCNRHYPLHQLTAPCCGPDTLHFTRAVVDKRYSKPKDPVVKCFLCGSLWDANGALVSMSNVWRRQEGFRSV